MSVTKNCTSSIRLDGKAMATDGSVSVQATKGIVFRLQNPAAKDVRITIKGTSPNTKLFINDFEKEFSNNHIVETDNNLNLIIRNRKQNLREPFVLLLGCRGEESKTVNTTFIFTRANTVSQPTDAAGTEDIIKAQADAALDEPDYLPGSAVYDALKLADQEKLTEYDYKKIMQFYFPKAIIDDPMKANEAAATNPFLSQLFDASFTPLKEDKSNAESGSSILSNLSLSSIGGLDVTGIADGVAKFLVKRAKEELSIAFFERMKAALDSIPDLRTLFPATTNLFYSAGNNVYDYKSYIQNLRESFKKDIGLLDENLPGIIDNHEALFAKYHTLAASLRTGCYFTGELKRQVHPGDILANYPVGFLKNENKNWSGAMQTLQLLSASLRDTSSADSTYWVRIKFVQQMVNNRKALQIFFGLLYQNAINNYNSIPFENNNSLIQLLDAFAKQYNAYDDYYNSYRIYIMQFAEKTETLNKMIKSYAKPESDSMAMELYKKYFDAATDMIDYTAKVGDLPFMNGSKFIADFRTVLSPYLRITSAVSDLVIDINRRNYSSAINQAVYIYSEVRTKPSQKEAMALQKTAQVSNSNHFNFTYKPAADSFARSENALNKLVKYGAFTAAVSTAQNSDEVESAIEAFALPAGSSSVKRTSGFNVSLNAFAGLFYGIEKIKDFDKSNTPPNLYGVTAPIGVAASWGRRLFFIPTGRHEWSTSVYVSLIDLGAVAAFRFKDSMVERVPTIQLKDIVSPGAFLSIGIPRTPLSFNAGAQAGPNLRKVTGTANDYSNKMYWRYSISLCVDIPLFNLYTR